MVVNSCYNCKNREVGCHANCEKYKEFKKKLDVINSRKQMLLFLERTTWRRC